jgi:hypothetical protein
MSTPEINAKDAEVLKRGLEEAVLNAQRRLYGALGQLPSGTNQTLKVFNELTQADPDKRKEIVYKNWGLLHHEKAADHLKILADTETELKSFKNAAIDDGFIEEDEEMDLE